MDPEITEETSAPDVGEEQGVEGERSAGIASGAREEQMIVEVALNLPLRTCFEYLPPQAAPLPALGSRVLVPFGTRLLHGVIVQFKATPSLPMEKLQRIRQVAPGLPLFREELLAFTRWVAQYYFCSWGEVLEAALPVGVSTQCKVFYRWREYPPPAGALQGLSKAFAERLRQTPAWNELLGEDQTPLEQAWLQAQIAPGGSIHAHVVFANREGEGEEVWLHATAQAPQSTHLPKRLGRETRKARLLRLIQEEGGIPIARARTVLSNPGPLIRALRDAGWIHSTRRPLAPAVPALPPPQPFLQLNGEQSAAVTTILQALQAGVYHTFLLQGVTGSGKTEVYLHAVREVLERGDSSLLLVPEIALTPAMVARFRARFREQVAVLHSGLRPTERCAEWSRVHAGEARIVIGARSAVFAPLKRLGLVIIDEEHDASYKQDETPRYHGRDAALMRALQNQAVVVLGSATPSMESVRNVQLGRYTLLSMPHRVAERPLPRVHMLDLKRERRVPGSAFFSQTLVAAMRETLLRKEQCLLFLNRRGYAALVECKTCIQPVLCQHCSVAMCWHRVDRVLRCHHCEHAQPMPKNCPSCGEANLHPCGIGTERIEEESVRIFPSARVLRMDSDSLRRRGELERMMEAISERRYNIIVGTQVLSKGHDFPWITLVGAVLADVSLNMPDFRAPERTFQVLTQIAGRAGRGDRPGEVYIQSYNPTHPSLRCACTHDNDGFAQWALAERKRAQNPPWRKQALVWVRAEDPAAASKKATHLAAALRAAARTRTPQVHILGADLAPIERKHKHYRYMILLKSQSMKLIHALLDEVLDPLRPHGNRRERVVVDVDPYNLF